jgi:FkbM family methyltransferase
MNPLPHLAVCAPGRDGVGARDATKRGKSATQRKLSRVAHEPTLASVRERLLAGLVRAGKQAVHRTLHRFGLDVHRFVWLNSVETRRRHALTERGVSVLLDVGANTGMYAQEARLLGFNGRIISFEPSSETYERLEQSTAHDPQWECRRLALGDRDGSSQLKLSANTYSSSFLPLTDRGLRAAPESKYVGTENVRVARLDALREELIDLDTRVFLKLDVQGTEQQVLRGARATLNQVEAIEVEVSIQPVYDGQALITEIVAYLDDAGFDLVALEPAFRDPRTGKLLQLDAFFLSRSHTE